MDITTPDMISKYQVIKVLGRGGMGEVLLAQDDLGRRVAIKRPFKSALADGLARFKVEAKAATLKHPNIPVVYEMGTQDDGLPFIAMEFVEGEPLDRLIASDKPLDLILKLSIIEQVCDGLGYAHANDIIHRDIKPANVIVQPNGVAKIIDFGIAKITNVEMTSELTQASQIIGSLHYIAPERFKAQVVDGRADIFSAGVMLYLLLTGNLPFAGGEATASYRIVNEPHGSLSTFIKDYPKALDGIMDRALAKEPDDRYSTAEDFAEALREVIDDLKASKVSALFSDAERLTMESRYDPALELLDEAMKLDSSNTQVRKLRRLVREHQERRRRADRVREYVSRADGYLGAENYAEALAQLKEAQRLDATSADLKERIAFVEDKKQRHDRSVAAMAEIEATRNRGDVTAALRIAERAVQADPENTTLLAARGAIAQQLEREVLQNRVASILESAQREFATQNFQAVESLLLEAEAIDASHPKIKELRRDVAQIREQNERRQLLDEIQRRVNEFLRANHYEQASELLNRAIEKLPSENSLHRLKMEVDTAARKFDSERFVEAAIAASRETFAKDPQRALENLRLAIEQMPGEERLISQERSLRQQLEVLRAQQVLNGSLLSAREFLAAQQPDRAINVLEAYQLEHEANSDVEDLLTFARQEVAAQQRRSLVEKTVAEVRSLLRDDRADEAISLLQSAMQNSSIRGTGDATLGGLLEDVRQQQAAIAHKLEVVQKRVSLLREREELDEAVLVVKDYLASGSHNATAQELLASLQADLERKQVTTKAIAFAVESAQQANFSAAFESLQAVKRAYGESSELAAATEQVDVIRRQHAQEVVSHSITTSRAALLRNDVPGALAALRAANEMVEFAEPAKQADWRRIGQAAKKAEKEPVAAGTVIADPLAEIPDAPPEQKKSPMLLIGIAAVCAIVAVVVGLIVLRKPPQPPPPPTEAHISIAKAPPGSLVAFDNGAQQPTDQNGELTVTVQPGEHLIEVSKEGFEKYTDRVKVNAGESVRENAVLVKAIPPDKRGTLVVQGNLAGFRVMVDGTPRGEVMKKEGTFTVEEGTRTVRYTNEDGTDTQEHKVQIVAGKSTLDTFSLKAPKPVVVEPKSPGTPPVATGSLLVETTPNAQVTVDGQSRGAADGSGKLTVNTLSAGTHAIGISLDKYQPVSGQTVTIVGGQPARFAQQLALIPPPPPSSGSLSVETTPLAQISINGQRKGNADGSGQFSLDNLAPGPYTLEISLENFLPKQQSITIRPNSSASVLLKLEPKLVAKAEPVTAPTPAPDTSAADNQSIQQALRNFEQAYMSRNLEGIKATWLNVGPRLKGLAGVLQNAEIVTIKESCEGQATISGDTATQNCFETSQYMKSDGPKRSAKKITFVKKGGKWIMSDKNP